MNHGSKDNHGRKLSKTKQNGGDHVGGGGVLLVQVGSLSIFSRQQHQMDHHEASEFWKEGFRSGAHHLMQILVHTLPIDISAILSPINQQLHHVLEPCLHPCAVLEHHKI